MLQFPQAGISRADIEAVFLSFCVELFSSDGFHGMQSHPVYEGTTCGHNVKYGPDKRKKHGRGEYHFVVISEEIDAKPYLESYEHQCCKHTYSCLQKRSFVAEEGTYSCCHEHYEHHDIWQFFMIHYFQIFSRWADDGRKRAEKHRNHEQCGDSYKICL